MSTVRTLCILGLLAAALMLCAGCTQPAPAGTTQTQATTIIPVPETPSVTTALTLVTTAAPASVTATTTATLSGKKVRFETSMGNITIALDPAMPITAGNFETLVEKGYYDGIIFHRVINGFMIQGGDPTGTGRGGPGYTIQDEFTSHNKNSRGAIAMANTGQPNSGGSQFFINLADNSALLNNQFDTMYPVFGNVVEGMDVVDAIGKTSTSGSPYDRPLQNITIIHAVMV
jgi:peptidylprolyl isomerase